jgi:hypothetical protein
MDARNPVVAPLVGDRAHLGRIGENPPVAVAQHGVVGPASLPQLVAHLQIFVGDVVAVVVAGLAGKADVAGAAVEIGGHDVPAGAALGEVVEGREPAGESIGMLERQRGGEPEAEMFRHHRHRGHELERIVDRDLRAIAQRRVEIAAIDVVDAEHVGDEQPVETAALEQLGEFGPVFEILVLPGAIARMRPQAGRLVPDAIHVEGVEPDLARHRRQIAPCRGGSTPFSQ